MDSGTTRRFPRWRSSASSRAAVRTALTPMLDHPCGVCGNLRALQHQTGREQRQLLRHSGHWAENEIERAAAFGWISGYPDGTFHPDARITRAEAMTMINRVLCRMPQSESDLLDSMVTWPDNKPSDWHYLAVQEATNSHDFDRQARSAKAGRS